MPACSSFLWCWKHILVSFAHVGKGNVALVICIELLLGAIATCHTRTKFQRAHSLMACSCFVWTLHSTVPNPNGKLANERCRTLEEKICKWKITTLSNVFAPLISKTSGSCYKHNELIISISPWGCICIRNLQCFSQWQIYIIFLKNILEAVWALFG